MGPHGSFDTKQVMAAEAENLSATADEKQVTAAEAHNLLAIEKTEVASSSPPVSSSIDSITKNIAILYISQPTGVDWEEVERKEMVEDTKMLSGRHW